MRSKKYYLLPFSLIYGAVTGMRNFAYNIHLLKSTKFSQVKVISIGNLSVGGTGKTPMVEYLIDTLSEKYKVAILSRGYGRKTSGYRLCSPSDTHKEIGDEPVQFVSKYKNIPIVVQENRRKGINNIIKNFPDTQIVILDDAFQHRRISPHLNIILTDYYNPFFSDHLLPVGNLRECKSNAKRADIIIVTKCNKVLSPIVAREIKDKIKPKKHQELLFSSVEFQEIKPVPGSLAESSPYNMNEKRYSTAICFSGIATNYLFFDEAKKIFDDIEMCEFKDHHEFTVEDLTKLKNKYDNNYGNRKFLLTTEKDACRLQTPELQPIVKQMMLYYLPLKTIFCNNGAEILNEKIDTLMKNN